MVKRTKKRVWLKEVEFLAYDEALGFTLVTLGGLGSRNSVCATQAHSAVNASDGELSFLIQVSLAITLLSSVLFIGKSYHWSCMARQVALAWAFLLACLAVLERLFHCV